MIRSSRKLGELLIAEGLITKEQLQEALLRQRQRKERPLLGEILIELRFVKEKDMTVALAKQMGVIYASKEKGLLRPDNAEELVKIVPGEFARRHLVLPLYRHLNSLTVAFVNPLDVIVIDNLKELTGCEINPVITTKTEMIEALNDLYGKEDLLKRAISESYNVGDEELRSVTEDEEEARAIDVHELMAEAEEAPVIKLVDLVVKDAIDHRASDIHIESFGGRASIRFRIDGHLFEMPPPPSHIFPAILSRIKIVAKMDIAERRLPQDGGFSVRMGDKVIDMRVSTIPTIYGEKVVIRVLDKTRIPLDLDYLGFEPKALEYFKEAIFKPYGIILITGPTGSGKTTTLYSSLKTIQTTAKNIITVEDPVEYRLDGIIQVQVKPKIGLTFAQALRAFLRQAPDIIMVGEIRDLETAESAVRAALTGHLVFSTLHTNDAPSATTRLVDIGVEPYLVTSSLQSVLAQRLVRLLCSECKESYEPTPRLLKELGLKQGITVYKARGCDDCRGTGYHGQTGIFEVMMMNEEIVSLVLKRSSAGLIREAAVRIGMKTLRDSALEKVKRGVTSLEEALRVTLEG